MIQNITTPSSKVFLSIPIHYKDSYVCQRMNVRKKGRKRTFTLISILMASEIKPGFWFLCTQGTHLLSICDCFQDSEWIILENLCRYGYRRWTLWPSHTRYPWHPLLATPASMGGTPTLLLSIEEQLSNRGPAWNLAKGLSGLSAGCIYGFSPVRGALLELLFSLIKTKMPSVQQVVYNR